MTSSTLSKHYLRVIRLWPVDALRGINVQDSLRRRLTAQLAPPSQPQTAPPMISTVKATKPDASAEPAATTSVVPAKLDEAAQMKQLNALYSLMENRYSNMYPTSEQLLEPAFKPEYYAQLAAEMEAAPKRSWLAQKWLRWSKLVRFN